MSTITISKLRLPFDELQPLYMRHLLLQQLVPVEVSLYTLWIGFRYTRKKTLWMSTNPSNYDRTIECWRNLCQLEDRHVNAVVAYRWASFSSCMSNVTKEQMTERYDNAYQLLMAVEPTKRNATQLCCLGLLFNEEDWALNNIDSALNYLELAANMDSTDALCSLAHLYQFGDDGRVDINYTSAVCYYIRAVELGCSEAMLRLAILLEDKPRLSDSHTPSFLDLYKKAALKGMQYAIDKCNKYGLSLK